jgi:hypothetical protein
VDTDYTFPLAEKVKAFLVDHLLLWLLPPLLPLLLLLWPPPKLKPRRSQRSQRRIWDLVSSTNHQKAANSTLFEKQGNKDLLSFKNKIK